MLPHSTFEPNTCLLQRACLEVHQAKRQVSYGSAVKWIRRHDLRKIDRWVLAPWGDAARRFTAGCRRAGCTGGWLGGASVCGCQWHTNPPALCACCCSCSCFRCRPLQPLELLTYLSDMVVSLVERLPKSTTTAALDLAANSSTAGGSGAARGSAAGVGASRALLEGADSGSLGLAAVAPTSGDRALAALTRRRQLQLLSDPGWQGPPGTDAGDALLACLAVSEAAGLEAALRQLRATSSAPAEEASASTTAATGSGSSSSSNSSGAGAEEPYGDAAAAPGAEPTVHASAAEAGGAAQQPDDGQTDASAGACAGGSGFTGRLALQMSGLQQQMSRAMLSLAGLARSSSGVGSSSSASASRAGSGLDATAAVEVVTAIEAAAAGTPDSTAAAAAASPHPATTGPTATERRQQQQTLLGQLSQASLTECQLEALQSLLGPGGVGCQAPAAAGLARVCLALHRDHRAVLCRNWWRSPLKFATATCHRACCCRCGPRRAASQ